MSPPNDAVALIAIAIALTEAPTIVPSDLIVVVPAGRGGLDAVAGGRVDRTANFPT